MKNLKFLPVLLLFACSDSESVQPKKHNWDTYLGDKYSSQYSNLDEINSDNVQNLQVAWTYSSNDKDPNNRSQIQCNPLIIDGVLYGTSAGLKLFALAADTGEELWVFDPFDNNFGSFGMGVNRGLVFYEDENKRRLF